MKFQKILLLGPVDGLEGFLNCCGWSGYGVMHAPVAGKIIAELVAHGKTETIDIEPFRLSRFPQCR